jgi:NAD(P)-dependent dehydrogenase (short-subunit alcohol dehydrogenase family)
MLCWLQVCDVSSLASVASFAADWLASSRPCHLLVNNAGVLVSTITCNPGDRRYTWPSQKI